MNSILIARIILGIAAFIFLILILRSKWKQNPKHIEEYAESRNKTTFRKKEEKKEEEQKDSRFSFSLSGLVGGFISLIVGVFLLGQINEAVQTASTELNATVVGYESLVATQQVLNSIPIVFAVALIMIVLGTIFSAFRNTGPEY